MFPITRLQNYSSFLCSFQLSVLLHQLLQTEARKLYRNLGLFTVSFAMIDGAFAIFGMLHLLPGPKSLFAFGFIERQLRYGKFLPARCEKLRDVVNRIVTASRVSRSPRLAGSAPVRTALIFILVSVVSLLLRFVWRGHSCPRMYPRRLPLPPRPSQFFN